MSLLVLLGENKDIINITKSSIWINFDHTMMEIYYYSFVSGVVTHFEALHKKRKKEKIQKNKKIY
jgi:hypothetical protein